MNFGTNFVLQQQFKSFQKTLNSGKIEEAATKLYDISSSLSVVDFNPRETLKYKKDALPLLLKTCLPLTFHEDLKIRLQAQSILNHWSSLVSSFSPLVLLEVYQNIDITTMKAEAHAAVFSFWTNALRFVNPEDRINYIGMLHSLLISSKPELLTNVANDVWILLRDTLTVSNILSFLPLLINSPLSQQVSFLCEKSPDPLFNYVLEKGQLEFIKVILPLWPEDLPVNIEIMEEKLLGAISSTNSSDISTAIEISSILMTRKNIGMNHKVIDIITKIIRACEELWCSSKATISQKAALIDFFSRTPFISLDCLDRLISFSDNIPGPIKIAIVRLCANFVESGKIPNGFFEFADKQLEDRDPLMYIAMLDFLSNCLGNLDKLSPRRAKILFLKCINPLPRYFVEKCAIIKILRKVDYNSLSFKIDVSRIVMEFLVDPQPSVINDLRLLISEKDIKINLFELDWLNYGQEYLPLISKVDFSIISELIDGGYISAASIPYALDAISASIDDDSDPAILKTLLQRSIYLVHSASHSLGFSSETKLWQLESKEWSMISDSFGEMLDTITDALDDSPFGKVVLGALKVLNATIRKISLHFAEIEGFFVIAINLAPAFTVECCHLLQGIKRSFEKTRHTTDKSKLKKVSQYIQKFFQQPMPFDCASIVASTAFACFEDPKEAINAARAYIENDAFNTPQSLQNIFEKGKTAPSRAFLFVDDDEYRKECANTIPFAEWILSENTSDFLNNYQEKIKITHNMEDLDESHRKFVKNHPEYFQLEELSVSPSNLTLIKIDVGLTETPIEFEEAKEPQEEKPAFDLEFQPYAHDKSSLSSIVEFLWNSDRKVPIEKFTLIEEALYPYAKNSRVVAALLGYAIRNSYKVETAKWASVMDINPTDQTFLSAFILLFSMISDTKYEDLKEERVLAHNLLLMLGANSDDPFSIIHFVETHSSLERNCGLILIKQDRSRFEEIPQAAFLCQSSEFIQEHILELADLAKTEGPHQLDLLSALSDSVFEFQESSPFDISVYPPNTIKMLERPRAGAARPQRDELPESVIGALLSVAEAGTSADHWILTALTSARLDYEQRTRVISLIRRGDFGPLIAHYHVEAKLNPKMTEEYEDRLGFLPPSYTRHIVKALVAPYAPHIDKKAVDKYMKKCTRVFTESLITGGSLIRKDLTNQALGAMLEVCGDCSPVTEKIFSFMTVALEFSQLYAPHVVARMAAMEDTEFRENLHQIALADAHAEFARQVMVHTASAHRLFIVEPIMRVLDGLVEKEAMYSVLEGDGFLDGKYLPALLIVVLHVCRRFSADGEDGERRMVELSKRSNSHAVAAMLERGFQNESLQISLSGAE